MKYEKKFEETGAASGPGITSVSIVSPLDAEFCSSGLATSSTFSSGTGGASGTGSSFGGFQLDYFLLFFSSISLLFMSPSGFPWGDSAAGALS